MTPALPNGHALLMMKPTMPVLFSPALFHKRARVARIRFASFTLKFRPLLFPVTFFFGKHLVCGSQLPGRGG